MTDLAPEVCRRHRVSDCGVCDEHDDDLWVHPRDLDERALDVAARQLKKERQAETAAMEFARIAAVAAIAHGMTEVDVAKQLGVNRMTVRRWLGKL